MVKCELDGGCLLIWDFDIDRPVDCELNEGGLCSINDYKICVGKLITQDSDMPIIELEPGEKRPNVIIETMEYGVGNAG